MVGRARVCVLEKRVGAEGKTAHVRIKTATDPEQRYISLENALLIRISISYQVSRINVRLGPCAYITGWAI